MRQWFDFLLQLIYTLYYNCFFFNLITFRIDCLFFLFKAAPVAYRCSQSRGQIGELAASLPHNHINARFQLPPWPTPQLMATLNPQPTDQGHGSNLHPYGHYVGFLTHWATMGTPWFLTIWSIYLCSLSTTTLQVVTN